MLTIKPSKIRIENHTLKDEIEKLKLKNENLDKLIKNIKLNKNISIETIIDINKKNDEISKLQDLFRSFLKKIMEFYDYHFEEYEIREKFEKGDKNKNIDEKFKLNFEKLFNFLEVNQTYLGENESNKALENRE